MAGERKQQILETLAKMLEAPKREKITTASLAAKLDVSEAALYRHFASKAQMFEGLISFIEQTVFGLINQIIKKRGIELKSITEIEFNAGPGSFTGLRVGAAVANTLGWTLGVPVNGKDVEKEGPIEPVYE